jgi:hypothetical protein
MLKNFVSESRMPGGRAVESVLLAFHGPRQVRLSCTVQSRSVYVLLRQLPGSACDVLRHNRECAGALRLIEDVNRDAGAFPIC